MDQLVQHLLQLSGWPVYVVVAIVIFGETAFLLGLVLPGEATLVLAAVLAARGNISGVGLGVLAFGAAVCGDTSGYWLGRRIGPRIESSRLGRRIAPERWAKAHARVARHGATAVLTARWVGFVRSVIPLIAGMAPIPYRRFLLADAAACASWVVGCLAIGFVAQGSWTRAQSLMSTLAFALVLVLGAVVLVACLLLVRRRRRQRVREPV